MESPARFNTPAVLLAALGVALFASPQPTFAIENAHRAALSAAMESITADELRTHVDVLADDTFEGREAGSRGGRAAAGYIVRFMQKYGLKGAGDDGGYMQSFGAGYANLLGVLPGVDPALKNEYIVVSGHYDHVGYGNPTNSYGPTGFIHNGADDNASGVSGLLETIEAFSKLPNAPRRSILFAFWDGEEKGLLGSQHYVSQPTIPLSRIKLMINLDMIGRLRNDRVEIFGTRSGFGLRKLVSQANADTNLIADYTWEMEANSDHHSFFARNTPVLMLHTGLHDDYHRPHDDAHKINVEGMRRVSRLLFGISHELANLDSVTSFRSAARNETVTGRQAMEQPGAKRPGRLGVAWRQVAGQDGLVLSQVAPGQAAEVAGLVAGDRLLAFNGRPIGDGRGLIQTVWTAKEPIELSIERQGESVPRTIVLKLPANPSRVGVAWRDDDAEPNSALLTEVTPGSPAHLAGLRVGDRLYEVGGQSFSGSQGLRDLFAAHDGKVAVVVERDGKLRVSEVELPAL
jgi:hypothetical protein